MAGSVRLVLMLQAVEAATADAAAARNGAAALQRELAVLRRHYEIDKLKLEAQVRRGCGVGRRFAGCGEGCGYLSVG